MTISIIRYKLATLRKYLSQFTPTDIKDVTQMHYGQTILKAIDEIFTHLVDDENALRLSFFQYLKVNVKLVRGNLLDYTATPLHPTTLLLSSIAEWLSETAPADEPMSPMQFMYSDLNLSSLSDHYPDLSVRQITLLTREEENEMKRLLQSIRYSQESHHKDWDEMRSLRDRIEGYQILFNQKVLPHDILNRIRVAVNHYKELKKKPGMQEYIYDKQQLDSLTAKKNASKFNPTHYTLKNNCLIPKQTLSQVLSTHILSEDMKSLIPVSEILSTFPQRIYDETGAPVTPEEKGRLEQHSMTTQVYIAALGTRDRLIKDGRGLYPHLMRLCKRLRLGDSNTGTGTNVSADSIAHEAILDFFKFYALIEPSQKRQIPESVTVQLDLLYRLSSDKKENTMGETCAHVRGEALELAIEDNEEQLLQIACAKDKSAALLMACLKHIETVSADIKNAYSDKKNIETHHSDRLPLRIEILKQLNINLQLNSRKDFNQFITLPSDEIILLGQIESTQKFLVSVFEEFDEFADFVRNTPNKKLEAFLLATRNYHHRTKINDVDLLINLFFVISEDKARVLTRGIQFNFNFKDRDGMTILHYAAKNNEELLHMLIDGCEQEQRLNALNVKNYQGETVLHAIANQHKLLIHILSLLSEHDRLCALNKNNNRNETVLYLVANNNPSLLEMLLHLLPPSSRLRAINQRSPQEKSLLGLFDSNPEFQEKLVNFLPQQHDQCCARLHAAVHHPEALKNLIYRVPKKDRLRSIIGINKSDIPLPQCITHTPELLKTLFTVIPKKERWLAANEKNLKDKSLLFTLINNALLLKQILRFIPKDDRFKAVYGSSGDDLTVLQASHVDNDLLEKILKLAPKRDRLRLVLLQTKSNSSNFNNLLNLVAKKAQSHLTILKLLPKRDRLNYATQFLYHSDTFEESPLCLLARSAKSLQIGLQFLPKNDRLNAIVARKGCIFYKASENNLFGVILSHLPVQDRLTAINSGLALSRAYYDECFKSTARTYADTPDKKQRFDPNNIELILSFLPAEDQMSALKKENCHGENFLEIATRRIELFKLIFNLYPTADFLNAINEKDCNGRTVLLKAAKNFESLKFLLDLYPTEERLKAVEERDRAGQGALFFAANNFQSLKWILNLYSKEECVDAVKRRNCEGKTILSYAANNWESVCLILNIYPVSERSSAVEEISNDVYSIAYSPELLNVIVSHYQEQERFNYIKQAVNKLPTFLAKTNSNPRFIRDLLDLIPELAPIHIVKRKIFLRVNDFIKDRVLKQKPYDNNLLNHIRNILLDPSEIEQSSMAKNISTLYQEEIKKEKAQHKQNRFKFFCCASHDKKLHIMFEEILEILVDKPCCEGLIYD